MPCEEIGSFFLEVNDCVRCTGHFLQLLETVTGPLPIPETTHLDESALLRAAGLETRLQQRRSETTSRKSNTEVRVRKQTPQIASEWLVVVTALQERRRGILSQTLLRSKES